MNMPHRSSALSFASLVFISICVSYVASSALNFVSTKQSSVSGLLTETRPPKGFSYAIEPHDFRFPRDHAAHPKFRSEWWYFTGNLVGKNGRDYAFDITFFRFALQAEEFTSQSPFRTSQIYLAHFAVADIENQTYLHAEKLARAFPEVAGATIDPIRVQVGNWSITQTNSSDEHWLLEAATKQFGMQLKLEAMRPIVLQGQNGLSRKSHEPGNASYYYSIPKLSVNGALSLDGETIDVSGDAWFDREWSTSALANGQVGWDWFGLQIADDIELMYYQIRRKDGRKNQENHGVLILDNGATNVILGSEIILTPLDYWTSPETSARYPISWRLQAPEHALDITVTAKFNDQQSTDTFTYWEGAVTTQGSFGQRTIQGHGFLEMTGYDR